MISSASKRSSLPIYQARQPSNDIDEAHFEGLEREIDIMGIDTVLDALFEYRCENGIDLEEEWAG